MRLLLDYDGVVLRSAAARDFQTRRSEEFLSRVTGLPISRARIVNARHKRCGHTVTLIRQLYPESTVTLEDYNKFVFDARAVRALQLEPRAKRELDRAAELVVAVSQIGVDCDVFTNAPSSWVRDTGFWDIPIISAENDLDMLKPAAAAFDRVESIRPGDFYVFIDDNDSNFCVPLQRKDRWHCVRFDDRNLDEYFE